MYDNPSIGQVLIQCIAGGIDESSHDMMAEQMRHASDDDIKAIIVQAMAQDTTMHSTLVRGYALVKTEPESLTPQKYRDRLFEELSMGAMVLHQLRGMDPISRLFTMTALAFLRTMDPDELVRLVEKYVIKRVTKVDEDRVEVEAHPLPSFMDDQREYECFQQSVHEHSGAEVRFEECRKPGKPH